MKFSFRSLAIMAALLLAAALRAQKDSESTPLTLGGFTTQGAVTAGYRFTDIKGYQPQFLEMFDLQQGLRLQDFNIYAEAIPGSNSFSDSYSVSMSGLGGDPFPTAQLAVSKTKLYDFRANWRQSYYYWNQNDNVILPVGMAGLTSNHDWATVRKFGSADFTLHATNKLRFDFSYYRTTDSGALFTTRAPDFFGEPGFWATYVRANPYVLYAPLNDNTHRVTGAADYTWRSWNFHYNIGYQTFDENITLNNVGSPETSINTSSKATSSRPLLALSWSQFRRLTTPISEFTFTGKPESKLEWRGEYIYYRYRGPASFDQSFNGIAPDSTGKLALYAVTQSGRANVTEPSHIISQGFTYRIKDWWDVTLDYRYSRFTSDGVGNTQSLFNATTPATGQTEIIWRDGTSDLDFSLAFTPDSKLVIRPGIHLMKADVETIEDGVIDDAHTLRIKTVWPELSFGYQPSKLFSVRGDVHSFTNGASYTAITPHTLVGGRLVVRVQPTAKLSFEDEINLSDSKLIDTNFRNNIYSTAATLSYSQSDRFSIFAGFSYESRFAQGDIVYVRGTPPLNDFLRDQEVNRVWQGGVEAKPVKHFGLRLSGNYDRSTGLGQITGEPPAYGPLTWPLVSGTVYYDFPKAGRLSIDLQRSYYIDQIVSANNFNAKMLTIRWTRDF